MTRETPEQPMKPVKPQTRTRENRTRKMWGKGLTGTGTGWPGIPQGYPWYSLVDTLPVHQRLFCNWDVLITIKIYPSLM